MTTTINSGPTIRFNVNASCITPSSSFVTQGQSIEEFYQAKEKALHDTAFAAIFDYAKFLESCEQVKGGWKS